VAEQNRSGLAFWRAVIAEAAGAPVTASTHANGPIVWHVFAFAPR
jgi:hypothetical protein